jgi:hypothetical protein
MAHMHTLKNRDHDLALLVGRGPAINLLSTSVTNTKQLFTFSYGSRHCPCHAYGDKIFHLEFPRTPDHE